MSIILSPLEHSLTGYQVVDLPEDIGKNVDCCELLLLGQRARSAEVPVPHGKPCARHSCHTLQVPLKLMNLALRIVSSKTVS
jgi:hypothetical protein